MGPVKAKFAGKVTLSDIDPPTGYTITGEGSGAAGFGKGGAAVKLGPDGEDATLLEYTAHAQVVGQPQDGADGDAETPARQEAPAPGGQLAAQPAAAAMVSFPAAPTAIPAVAGDPPVDRRLVAMVGAATVAFVAILFLVAGG